MQSLRYPNIEIDEHFRKSLDFNPTRGSVHYFYNLFLSSIGRAIEAKSHLEKSKTLGYIPKHPGHRNTQHRSNNSRSKSRYRS
jgi:Tfp pilus assembly protein PilF